MQGKGFIRFFAIVLAIVFLGQFILTYPTSTVERNANNHANSVAAAGGDYKSARAAFLDSMSTVKIAGTKWLKEYTYQDLKKQQLALGLDLKGGMSVVLQVDLQEFVRTMGNNSKDPAFVSALNKATETLSKGGGSDYISVFAAEFKAASNGQPMASVFSRNEALSNDIKFDSGDDVVLRVLRQKANETVKSTYDRLKERIDEFGVTQPNVSLDASRDLIVVELPGVDNPKRARNMLSATAKLEFWDIYRLTDPGVFPALQAADAKAKAMMSGDTSSVTVVDTSATAQRGPIFNNLQINGQMAYGPAVLGLADKSKIKYINEWLEKPAVKGLFPSDMIFSWSQKPVKANATDGEGSIYELYALKAKRGASGAGLDGGCVTNASVSPDETGKAAVSLKMNTTGARIWGEMTTAAFNDKKKQIAVVLDDKVVSAPNVNSPILSGDSQITGNYTIEEAQDFARILQIGKLPAKTKIIQESVVGPSLGQDNINKSLLSLGLGLLAIILLMSTYYSSAGILAIVGLLVNIFFIIGSLTSYGTVLTLPGIAGIVLTMASAVDANVIIYERCREELALGKKLLDSIRDGFKHSYPAIFDANISNLLIAFVMAYFGLGPIKGFAVVLIIGIVSTLFTAVFLVQYLMEWWMNRGNDVKFSQPWSSKILRNVNYDWVGKRKYAYIGSSIVILLGIGSYFMRGFELGVDFKGGYSYNVQFADNSNVNVEALRTAIEANLSSGGVPIVKAIDTKNSFNIVTSYLIDDSSTEASDKVTAKIHEAINTLTPVSLDEFKMHDYVGTHITSFSKVGSYVADDIRNSAFKATALSLLLIFLYITFRFSKWQFSLGAVIALFHDVLLVLALFSMLHGILPFSMEIDQAFVAALLTVIGYSMNDTVVVYDRIREFINKYSGKSKAEVINDAINNTLSRTVMTSFITFLSMFILFAFGGSSVRGFAFALVVGIVVGTYSSIFVATPIMVDLTSENLTDAPKPVQKKSAANA
ncbi:MAG: protein translocase subunit SecDF [Saprospiraceae bacterium]